MDTKDRRDVDRRADAEKRKDPAAVSLGERGGKVGGPARAAALPAKEREEIARKGGEARARGK